jgi:putative oxidoreductase
METRTMRPVTSTSKEPSMNPDRSAALAATLLRVALGAMFVAHALLKVFVFTLPGTAQFFGSLGLPGWMAYPVAIGELVGGVLLIAGIGSRAVALTLLPVLLGAAWVHAGNGWLFSAPNGGWEYPAFLAAVAAAVALLGDGAYAISFRAASPRTPRLPAGSATAVR